MMEISWGEHIFLDFKNKEEAELEQGKISFKMMDKGIFKDELIGYYEFDLSYVKDWTSVIEDNMNPLFYETLTFTVEALGID